MLYFFHHLPFSTHVKDPDLPLTEKRLLVLVYSSWLAKWCLSSFNYSFSEPFEACVVFRTYLFVERMGTSVSIYSKYIWRGSKLSAQSFDGVKGKRAIIFPLIVPTKVKQ